METQLNDEIQHHGIKNQKWGVKNGPPYPLERPCSVDRNAGETIPAGTTIYRVTNDPFNDINRGFMYATYKESDRNYYKAGWDASKGTRLRYESSYTTNVDLKIPSVNERIAISKKVFDENIALVVEAYNAYKLHHDWRYSDALLLSRSMAKLSKAKGDSAISKVDLSELESKAGPVDLNTRKNMRAQYNFYQDVVTQAPDDIKTQFSALGMSYSDELKGKFAEEHLKRGYNCMFDDHGTHTGGKDGKTTIRMVDSAIIVIDPSKTLKAGPSTMITDKDRQRANKQYLKWQDGTKVKIDNCPLSMEDVSREDGSLSHSDDRPYDSYLPVLQDPEHPLTIKDLFEYFKLQNENSDTIEHKGVKGMKWKNHVKQAEQVIAGLGGMTVATANKALKKLALKKIKEKKSKRTRKRYSSKRKKALKKIVSKRKTSKVIKGSGTIKALTDGPTKAKKPTTSVTPYKSKFKLTSAMKQRAKNLGFRHSDYINSLVQVDDLSQTLEHHSTKGQKWGVKNGPPYPLERPCSVDRNAGETIPKGSTLYVYSRDPNGADTNGVLYAAYKELDRHSCKAKLDYNWAADDFDGGNKYEIECIASADLKIPSVNERTSIYSAVYDKCIDGIVAANEADFLYIDAGVEKEDAKMLAQMQLDLAKAKTDEDLMNVSLSRDVAAHGYKVSLEPLHNAKIINSGDRMNLEDRKEIRDSFNASKRFQNYSDVSDPKKRARLIAYAMEYNDDVKNVVAEEHLKRGYNCIVDDYNAGNGKQRFGDTPIMVINPSDTLSVKKSTKYTNDDARKDLQGMYRWIEANESKTPKSENWMLTIYDKDTVEHSEEFQNGLLIQKESLKNAITHSGVKGQRWGVKHGPPYPLGVDAKAAYKKVRKAVETGIKASRKAAKAIGKAHKAVVLGPTDSEGKPLNWRRLSNRQLRTMSSKEIQVAKNRLKLENEYREAYSKTPEGQKAKARKEAISKVKTAAIKTSKKLLVTGGTALAREVFDGDPIMTAAINALAGKPKQDNNNNNNNKKKDKNNNKTVSSGVKKYITSKLKGPKQREEERKEKDAARTKAIAKILAEEYQKSPTVSKYVGPNGNAVISQTNKDKKYKTLNKKEKT